MLRKLFPPANELTLFVTAATLISLFFYMEGWTQETVEIIAGYFSDAFVEIDKAKNIFESFISFFTILFLLPATIIVCVIAPLIMPFTRWDLRLWCVWILILDCVLLSIYNIKIAFQTPTKFQVILAIYCLAWTIYTYFCLESNKIDNLIDKTKTSPILAVIAAGFSIIGVFIAIQFYSIDWIKAYTIGIMSTSTLFSIPLNKPSI